MMTVETSGLLRTTTVDEPRFAAFVAKMVASYRRSRDKHTKAGRGMYFGWTDAQCQEAARFYCGVYRNQFLKTEPVNG